MKTLILNGSPRANGDTARLIGELLSCLGGERLLIDAYSAAIRPCVDCRYCVERDGCSQNDAMREVYDYIEACDAVVIASPIYFSQLTGPLLSVASRLQRYFCARHFRGVEPIAKGKRGGVMLVGGGDGHMDGAYDTACALLRMMNARDIAPLVSSHGTDAVPAGRDAAALAGARSLAGFLRGEGFALPLISPIRQEHRAKVAAFLVKRWYSTEMLIRGRVYDLSAARGFIAFDESGREVIGLATYVTEGDVCELTSLDSARTRQGLGGALLEAVVNAARESGCGRLQLITTNDNIAAMRFYQRHGFDMAGLNLRAVDRERAKKSEIPSVGLNGIPLRHEVEFAMEL